MAPRSPLIIHYVHDMRRALAFYSALLERHPSFESLGWTTFDCDGFQLALHILAPDGTDDAVMPNAGLNLLVDEIEVTLGVIERHGGRLRELREPDDFVPVRVASFFDSEGNGFELRQAVSAPG